MSLPPSVIIDDFTFTYADKYISNDRIHVRLKSQNVNSTEEPYEFVVYRSNSQGLWRYYACALVLCCPCKCSDYTVTTLIDFRLQTYLNTHLDNIARIDNKYELASAWLFSVSDFIDKQRIAYQHVFGVIFHLFQTTETDWVNMPRLVNKKLDFILPEEEEPKYLETKAEFFTLFTEEEKGNTQFYIIDALDKISAFIEARFTLLGNPTYVTTIAKHVISFENASMKDGIIKEEHINTWGEKCSKTLEYNSGCSTTVLYPYSKDIYIFNIIIQHNKDGSKYRLFYMQYSIEGDDTVYYMPVCITPENTKITKYGLTDKYCPSGMYCNKPWDYLRQCFYKKSNKTKKQICRATDNYAFIGNNYVDLWPFNTETILTKSIPEPGPNTPAPKPKTPEPSINTPEPGPNTPAPKPKTHASRTREQYSAIHPGKVNFINLE